MRDQRKDEPRVEYLARVLYAYMEQFGDGVICFDGVDCDGLCLANDVCSAVGIDPEYVDESVWVKELKHLKDQE